MGERGRHRASTGTGSPGREEQGNSNRHPGGAEKPWSRVSRGQAGCAESYQGVRRRVHRRRACDQLRPSGRGEAPAERTDGGGGAGRRRASPATARRARGRSRPGCSAPPAQDAALAAKRCYADEGRDLLAVQVPAFRQLGDRCRRQDRVDARHALHKGVVPRRAGRARDERRSSTVQVGGGHFLTAADGDAAPPRPPALHVFERAVADPSGARSAAPSAQRERPDRRAARHAAIRRGAAPR